MGWGAGRLGEDSQQLLGMVNSRELPLSSPRTKNRNCSCLNNTGEKEKGFVRSCDTLVKTGKSQGPHT
jgi:hypothetical protein